MITITADYQKMPFLIIPAQFYPKPENPVIAFHLYMCVTIFCTGANGKLPHKFYLEHYISTHKMLFVYETHKISQLFIPNQFHIALIAFWLPTPHISFKPFALCFVRSVWKWLKTPWVSENDLFISVACFKSVKTFQTSKGGFAFLGHFCVPFSMAQEGLVIWIN